MHLERHAQLSGGPQPRVAYTTQQSWGGMHTQMMFWSCPVYAVAGALTDLQTD